MKRISFDPRSLSSPQPLGVSNPLPEQPDILVGQIACRDILQCPSTTPLQDVARKMSHHKVSSTLIIDHGVLTGIWTERDSLKLDLDDPACLNQPVSTVMSSPVKTVPADMSLKELAMQFRKERIRHYVVVDGDNQYCGVVSQSDVIINQGIEHYLHLRTLDTVLHQGLQRLPHQATPAEVTRLMRDAAVDAVVIDYDDRGLGIISERDMVRYIAGGADPALRAGDIASRPLVCVAQNSSLYQVRNLLIHEGFRHIGVTDTKGELVGLVSFSDILGSMELSYVHELQAALQERDEALSISRHQLCLAEQVIESSLEGILVADMNNRIVFVNPAFTRLTGYSAEEAIGQSPALLSSGQHGADFYQAMWEHIKEKGSWQGEIWNRRKSGEAFPELLTITTLTDPQGNPTHYAALFDDISVQKKNEEEIRRLAYYDALTGLPNRRLFEDRLDMAITQARHNNEMLAVLFIDLDFFKRINDSLGHAAGDDVLNIVSQRFKDILRPQDTLARQGGDEFVALLRDIRMPSQAMQISKQLLESLKQPLHCMNHDLQISCTIGISLYPDDSQNSEELLGMADAAMYQAKGTGRNNVKLYTGAMNQQSRQRIALEHALYKAVEHNEFELHYQPILDASTRQIKGVEALLRWNRGDLGWQAPDSFLPVAEDLNLMSQITSWVMETACRQQVQWVRAGLGNIMMSINMADRHFQHEHFEQMVQECLRVTECDPHHIILELTERMLLDRKELTCEHLRRLREQGFKILLDDFGTGWSSLTHLRTFPLDGLKIDRDFTRHLGNAQARESIIIESLILLADKLDLLVVAEGVETSPQEHILQQMGCHFLQGYLYSRPLPAGKITELLRQNQQSGA